MPGEIHDHLCERAEKWLKNQNCGVVFNESFQAVTSSGEQPDALGFRSGCSILIECKASRSDFLSDKKKRFRKDPAQGVGDWRFYMCPPGVINIEDLPEGWGLLWVHPKKVEKVHGIPPNTLWESDKPFTGNKDNELRLMYSALRRVKIRGHFDCIYEKLVA
tara:strand:+ start:256 stop:741 length:486 start_codon:yes stop_codon:yes gene_type:complete